MTRSGERSGNRRFALYAWLVLAYTILVILWGTVVRATGSGAGCGDHWPLCGGQVFPRAAQIATLIEFAHRLTSGLVVALVVGLVYFAFRRFPARHLARRYAGAALFFTITEALLGAALVLLGETGTNASMSRVFFLSLHLVNTFFLLASLALTAQAFAEDLPAPIAQPPPRGRRPAASRHRLLAAYGAGLLGTLAVAVTGTIAALADSLFHATSLAQAFQWDFSGSVSPLLRLRIIHPVVAVVVGTFLLVLALHPLIAPAPPAARRLAPCLLALVLLQFCLGGLNVLLLSPLWIQVVHLLTADLIWITLVLLTAVLLRDPALASSSLAREPVALAASPGRSP
ncbi:MAG: COX15/CtaA family protein [Terriglobia bacterium]